MHKNIAWFGVLLVIVGLLAFAVNFNLKNTSKTNSNKLQVVTTLFPLYDFAKNIGGDKVEVSLLLPPGVEPHAFEPKPSDIVKINEADVFVYTGKYMETWVEDILKGRSNYNALVVDSSVGIELVASADDDHEGEKEEEVGHQHTGVDPHIWLDFANAQTITSGIANAMTQQDPANAEFYSANLDKYNNELELLDTNFRNTLSSCTNKEIVYGGHYAFGYMIKRYGLSYASAQGFSPDAEPTANDLISLVKQIKSHGIKYIFYEELSSAKIAQTLASETSAQMLLLNGAHNLTKVDLESGVGFIDLMKRNLNNLSLGLGCSR